MMLAVSPHPDDTEWGAAGLLAARSGGLLYVVAADSEPRWAEAQAAAQALGVTALRGPATDGAVAAAEGLVRLDLETLIATHQPDLVLVPPDGDTHQDHRATRRAAMSALRRQPVTVAEYETPSAPPGWAPDLFAEVSATDLAAALTALEMHRSQAHRRYMASDLALARMIVAGAGVGLAWAVPLRLVRGVMTGARP